MLQRAPDFDGFAEGNKGRWNSKSQQALTPLQELWIYMRKFCKWWRLFLSKDIRVLRFERCRGLEKVNYMFFVLTVLWERFRKILEISQNFERKSLVVASAVLVRPKLFLPVPKRVLGPRWHFTACAWGCRWRFFTPLPQLPGKQLWMLSWELCTSYGLLSLKTM